MNGQEEYRGIRTGTHKKGRRTVAHILEQATRVLIRHGYSKFSLRQVASAADVALGNLQYYFPTKGDLVEAMLVHVIGGYIEEFERLKAEADGSPQEQLGAVLSHVIRDLNNPLTTALFPELWSMANHDATAEFFVEQMYESYRGIVADLVRRINPRLNADQVRLLTIFVTSSIEGHTPFIGHKKRWRYLTPGIEDMAIDTFIALIESGKVPTIPEQQHD